MVSCDNTNSKHVIPGSRTSRKFAEGAVSSLIKYYFYYSLLVLDNNIRESKSFYRASVHVIEQLLVQLAAAKTNLT